MNVSQGVLAGIAVMAAVTLALRFGGYLAMRRVPRTPAVLRALAALPGSLMVAAAVPLALEGGPVGVLAALAAAGAMRAAGSDLLALLAGLGAAAALRAAGL